MNRNSSSNALGNEKMFRFASYALVFLMMACVLMTFASLIQNLLPHWHSGVIAGVLLLIVIDRLYTYQQLKPLTFLSSEWVTAYATQWIVIAVFIRFLLSYANGLDAFRTDLSLFARGYIENILTPEYIMTLFLAFLVWVLTAQFLTLLDEIGLDAQVALREESAHVPSEMVPAHQRLVSLIFSLGIFLVVLTVLARINLRSTFSDTSGIPDVVWNRLSGVEAGALLYFAFGLALLSLSRLMSLQTHWNRMRIPVSSKNLTKQWGMYSLFFLLILAVIVSLLPAGDSLGFFSILGTVLGFLVGVLAFLSLLIVNLIFILFSLPFLLFGKAPPFLGRVAPIPPLTLPTQPMSPIDSSAFLALLRSILLWGALAAIIIFSVIAFVRQHESILAALRRSRITNWLLLAWQWLYRGANKSRVILSRAIADGWQSLLARLEGKRSLPRPGWISLRSLDPRRQIYFFYLAMIRRGNEQGLRRRPSQTPSEYAITLEKDLPASEEDIDSITRAFVEARYSRQEVQSTDADRVKATWGRIRQALKSKAKRDAGVAITG
jgi:hypothetical protein